MNFHTFLNPENSTFQFHVKTSQFLNVLTKTVDLTYFFSFFFQNVSFRYNESTPYIYKNLEFGLDLDSRLALVGPNGAGKSTLLKLVYGELVPSEGKSQCGKTRILLSLEIFLISHNFLIFLRYGSTKQPFENRQIPPTFTRIIGHGFITFGLHDEKIPGNQRKR